MEASMYVTAVWSVHEAPNNRLPPSSLCQTPLSRGHWGQCGGRGLLATWGGDTCEHSFGAGFATSLQQQELKHSKPRVERLMGATPHLLLCNPTATVSVLATSGKRRKNHPGLDSSHFWHKSYSRVAENSIYTAGIEIMVIFIGV